MHARARGRVRGAGSRPGLRRLVVGATAVALVVPAALAAADTTAPGARPLADALASDPTQVRGAAFEALPPKTSGTAVLTTPLAGFPTSGADYAVLSTGSAADAAQPNDEDATTTYLDGDNVRGNADYDVTVLRVDLQVPATANCLLGLDFRFLSEEFPEYVGGDFNDAFIAELDRSTWTTSGTEITAPDNFAFDPSGSPITINAAGETSMSAEDAEGTTYDGATPLLSAATPISPGAHSLFLSIFDNGDDAYDSTVFLDNLRLGAVADPATQCRPGAQPVEDERVTGSGTATQRGEVFQFTIDASDGADGPAISCSVTGNRGTRIVCLTSTSHVTTGDTARITGTARLNGRTTSFVLDVVDTGAGASTPDSYALRIGGKDYGGRLTSGDLVVEDGTS